MQENSALGRALAMVRDLRNRCPWDRAQTRESLRPYLVEEVLELDHALGEGEIGHIRDELSDLLLHLAFQLVIAEERRDFSPDDVAEGLERKMRRRHPHLFELGEAEPWERIKRKERRWPASCRRCTRCSRPTGSRSAPHRWGSTGPTPPDPPRRCVRSWRRSRRSWETLSAHRLAPPPPIPTRRHRGRATPWRRRSGTCCSRW